MAATQADQGACGEGVKMTTCSCQIGLDVSSNPVKDIIIYCPMHKSAEDMFKSLVSISMKGSQCDEKCFDLHEIAEKALERARGEK